MNEEEGRKLIFNIIDMLAKDGFNISRKNIETVAFKNIDNACGYTLFANDTTYNLVINKKLLAADKLNFFRCVVFHELAHIIQYNEALTNNLIKYDPETDEIIIICEDINVAESIVFDNFHHTKFWLSVINEMNNRYNIIPKITAFLAKDDLNKFLEGIFMNTRRIKNEPHIDYTVSGLTLDDMMRLNIKAEYQTLNQINEKYTPDHSYRELTKCNKQGE